MNPFPLLAPLSRPNPASPVASTSTSSSARTTISLPSNTVDLADDGDSGDAGKKKRASLANNAVNIKDGDGSSDEEGFVCTGMSFPDQDYGRKNDGIRIASTRGAAASASLSPAVSTPGSSTRTDRMARKQVSSWLTKQKPSSSASPTARSAVNTSRAALSPVTQVSASSLSAASSSSSSTAMPPPSTSTSRSVLAARKQCQSPVPPKQNGHTSAPRLRPIAPRPAPSSITPTAIMTSTPAPAASSSTSVKLEPSANIARPSEQKRKADALASRGTKRRKLSPGPLRIINPEDVIDMTMSDDDEEAASQTPKNGNHLKRGLDGPQRPPFSSPKNGKKQQEEQAGSTSATPLGGLAKAALASSWTVRFPTDVVRQLTEKVRSMPVPARNIHIPPQSTPKAPPTLDPGKSRPAAPVKSTVPSSSALSTSSPNNDKLRHAGPSAPPPIATASVASAASGSSSAHGPKSDSRSVWASVHDPSDPSWSNFPKTSNITDPDSGVIGTCRCTDAYNKRHAVHGRRKQRPGNKLFLLRNVRAVVAAIAVEQFPALSESWDHQRARTDIGRIERNRCRSLKRIPSSSALDILYQRRLLDERNLKTARIARILELPIKGLEAFDASLRPVHLAMKDIPRMAQMEMEVHFVSIPSMPLLAGLLTSIKAAMPSNDRTFSLMSEPMNRFGSVIRQSLEDLLSEPYARNRNEMRRIMASNITIQFSFLLTDASREPYEGVRGKFESQPILLAGFDGEILAIDQPIFTHPRSALRWKLFDTPRWAMDNTQSLKPMPLAERQPDAQDEIDLTWIFRDGSTNGPDEEVCDDEWRCPSSDCAEPQFQNELQVAVHMALAHHGEFWVEPDIGPRYEVDGMERARLIVHEGKKPIEKIPEPGIPPEAEIHAHLDSPLELENQLRSGSAQTEELQRDLIEGSVDLGASDGDVVDSSMEVDESPISPHLAPPPKLSTSVILVTAEKLHEPVATSDESGTVSIATPQSQYDDPISANKDKHSGSETSVLLDVNLIQESTNLDLVGTVNIVSELEGKETQSGLAGPYMGNRVNKWTQWSNRIEPGTLADLMPQLDKIYDGGKDRHNMRDIEELHIWQQHHLSPESRFLACCWNRWKHQHVSIPHSDPTVYYEAWIDAYGRIMAEVGITNKLRTFIYMHYKHKYITFKVYARATAYYNGRYPKWSSNKDKDKDGIHVSNGDRGPSSVLPVEKRG